MLRNRLTACTLIFLCSGCASGMSLTATATDQSSGRALAKKVADPAGCGSMEDFDLQPGKYAVFTCQRGKGGERMFSIWTFFNQVARGEQITKLSAQGQVFLTGEGYVVAEAETPGRSNTAADFAGFPGAVTSPSATSSPGVSKSS